MSRLFVPGEGMKAGIHLDALVGEVGKPGKWDHHFPLHFDRTLAALRFGRICHRWFSYSAEHKIVWVNIWHDRGIEIREILKDFCGHYGKMVLLWEESDSEVIDSLKFEFCFDPTFPYFREKNCRHFVG